MSRHVLRRAALRDTADDRAGPYPPDRDGYRHGLCVRRDDVRDDARLRAKSDTNPDTNPDTNTNTNTDTDAHADTDADTNAVAVADPGSDADLDQL
jgi:hypothetical protein